MLEVRLRLCALCGLSAVLWAVVASQVRAQERPEEGSLVITATGFRNATGQATIMLLDSPEAFDVADMRDERKRWKKVHRALADVKITKSGRALVVQHRIEHLEPGDYVAFVIHDLNKNGRLDSNLIGIPQEPFGMSNNFRPQLLPVPQRPTWAKLAFRVQPGENEIKIKVQE